MNNEGWGLSTMLAICGVLSFCLVIIVIIIEVNFKPLKEPIVEKPVVTASDQTEEQEDWTAYHFLEDTLEEAARKNHFSEDQIITSEELMDQGFLKALEDPSGVECIGYVEYKAKTNEYTSYLRCPGVYRTPHYQITLE